jgi:hypothetical protein
MMEKVNFEGWPNCIKLSNNNIELIVTTDVGPRIIRFGFKNEQNFLYVSPDDKGKTGGNNWRIYGGHRLWHSPEVMPRTYCPDNNPVAHSWDGKTLKLFQEIESTTGLVKEMEITLDPNKNQVIVFHRIINKSAWNIELAPWAISAMEGGGRAILPQEPYVDPADFLLPARPIVLWHYTQMKDPRWIWGNKYIQLKHDSTRTSEQKIGILNKQKWAAYYLNGELFIKRFDFNHEAQYADYGCNNEAYVNGDFVEIETLGPLTKIAPQDAIEHTEHWMLTNLVATLEENEKSIDTNVIPLV